MRASDSCHLKAVQLLIEHGAQVNLSRDKRKNRAAAVREGERLFVVGVLKPGSCLDCLRLL